MNLYICGIVDIVVVLVGIVLMIIGYKRGFMHKALSLFGFLAIVLVSFAFCTQLAALLTEHEVIAPSICSNITNSINEGLAANVADLPENATASQVIQYGMGWPEFLANMVASMAGVGEKTQAELVESVATGMTEISMNVICFVIIFIVSYLVLAICKILTSILRGVKAIRIIDGVLGVVLYLALYTVAVCLVFLILHYMMDASWFSGAKDFLYIDMQLGPDHEGVFRISKWIYETNPILSIFKMLGWA